jgi:hypothetical protein
MAQFGLPTTLLSAYQLPMVEMQPEVCLGS